MNLIMEKRRGGLKQDLWDTSPKVRGVSTDKNVRSYAGSTSVVDYNELIGLMLTI